MTAYTQSEIGAVFDGGSFYINESSWSEINAQDRAPRECDVHCVQMPDGVILAFDDCVPDEADDFNSDWILAYSPKTGSFSIPLEYNPDTDKFYVGLFDQYTLDVARIIMITGVDKEGKLKSN
jgi:hypothetical protein